MDHRKRGGWQVREREALRAALRWIIFRKGHLCEDCDTTFGVIGWNEVKRCNSIRVMHLGGCPATRNGHSKWACEQFLVAALHECGFSVADYGDRFVVGPALELPAR